MIQLRRAGKRWKARLFVGNRVPVYLDNFAVLTLAKESRVGLRRQFIDALRRRGRLLFSITNFVELAGPQGHTVEQVRGFLKDVGSHWMPVEMDPYVVCERESRGNVLEPHASLGFIDAFMQQRFAELSEGEEPQREDFFNLALVLDWIRADRDYWREQSRQMDEMMRRKIAEWRTDYDAGLRGIDQDAALPFEPARPATYVFLQMLQTLVRQAKSFAFKDGDALDLCHAVMAASYASFATLDRQWKARVEAMPEAARLARVYYAPELERFVGDFAAATEI
jgi:hypothetical protein